MSSNPQFSELANWDGKLSQAGSSTSSPRMNTANLTGSRTPNTQVNTSIDLIPTRTLPALFTVANSGVTAQSPQVNGKVDTAVSMFPSSSSVTSPPRSSEPIRVSEKSIAPESLPTTVQCLQPLPPIPTHSSNTPPSLPQISKPTSPEMHTAASDTRFDHSQGSEAELEEMLVVDSILKEPSVSSISSVDTSSPSVSLVRGYVTLSVRQQRHIDSQSLQLEGNGTVAAAPRSPELKNTKPSSIVSLPPFKNMAHI